VEKRDLMNSESHATVPAIPWQLMRTSKLASRACRKNAFIRHSSDRKDENQLIDVENRHRSWNLKTSCSEGAGAGLTSSGQRDRISVASSTGTHHDNRCCTNKDPAWRALYCTSRRFLQLRDCGQKKKKNPAWRAFHCTSGQALNLRCRGKTAKLPAWRAFHFTSCQTLNLWNHNRLCFARASHVAPLFNVLAMWQTKHLFVSSAALVRVYEMTSSPTGCAHGSVSGPRRLRG